MKWIPVNSKYKPENNTNTLVYFEHSDFITSCLFKDGKFLDSCLPSSYYTYEITHWMYAPEKPNNLPKIKCCNCESNLEYHLQEFKDKSQTLYIEHCKKCKDGYS